MRSAVRWLLLLVVCCAADATVARAHAVLLQTEPASNAQLAIAPNAVRLSFDERVESVFNSIQVLDKDGRRVDNGNPRVVGEGDVVEIGLRSLTPGPYTVVWRVNSVDGHEVGGHFGFGLQSSPPSEEAMKGLSIAKEDALLQIFSVAAKWLGLLGMMVWLGGISFLLLVFGPALSRASKMEPGETAIVRTASRRIHRLFWTGAIVFLIGQVLSLIAEGMTLADLPLAEVLSVSTMKTLLFMTNFGTWWLVRAIAAVLLLFLCEWQLRPTISGATDGNLPRSRPLLGVGSAALGSLMLISIPLSGHARAVARASAVAVILDWAHLVCTAVWIGGLVFLWRVALLLDETQQEQAALLNHLVSRFSNIARICVAILLGTGVYAAWLHIPSWPAFVSTEYGRVLLLKLALVVLILLIAAVNLRRVLPALARFTRERENAIKWARRFRTLVTAETTLGGLVLLSVALLTSLPPASAVATTGPISLEQPSGGTTVELKLESGRVGAEHAVVTLLDTNGRTIADARRVTLYLRMLDMDMGLQTVEAQPAPDGTYQADITLAMAGRWEISVEVSPPHGDTFVTEFKISSGL